MSRVVFSHRWFSEEGLRRLEERIRRELPQVERDEDVQRLMLMQARIYGGEKGIREVLDALRAMMPSAGFGRLLVEFARSSDAAEVLRAGYRIKETRWRARHCCCSSA